MADILDFEDDVATFPREGGPYRAFGWRGDPAISLSFAFRDGRIVTYPYRRLLTTEFAPAGAGECDRVVARFDVATRVDAVTVEGHALWALWDRLAEQCAAWVRELPEGARTDGGPAVTAIRLASEPVARPPGLRRL